MTCTQKFKESVTVTQILDLVTYFLTHRWVMIHVCVKFHETDQKTLKLTAQTQFFTDRSL